MKKLLRLYKANVEHVIEVNVENAIDGIDVVARYVSGSLQISPQTEIANWPVRYEPPNAYDKGRVTIGNGRIEILIPQLRKLGLGSFLMWILITWIKKQSSVPVDPILLKGQDAATEDARESRNHFYEKFGFSFNYKDGRIWGESHPMLSANLLAPDPKFADGWKVECI